MKYITDKMTMNAILRHMYLDYVNNYLTVGVFAERNEIKKEQAETLICIGRKLHEEHCDLAGEAK